MEIESFSLGNQDEGEPWSQEKNSIIDSTNILLENKESFTSQEKQLSLVIENSLNSSENCSYGSKFDEKFSKNNYQINSLGCFSIKTSQNKQINNSQRFSFSLQQRSQRIQDFQDIVKKEQCRYELKSNSHHPEDISNNKNSQQTLNISKHLFPQITHFILFGIIRFDFEVPEDYQFNQKEQERQQLGNIYFRVIQVEKKLSRFFLQIGHGFFKEFFYNSEWTKYDLLAQSLEQSNNKIFYELAKMIRQLRIFYDQYEKHLELIRIFHAKCYSRLMNIQSLRIEYMKNIANKLKEELKYTENDFIVTLYFSPNFAQKIQALHSMEINLAFMSLVGVTEEEFEAMVMRYGISCWYEKNSSEQFNNALVRGILSEDNYYEETINDQRIKTFDDFQLNCSTHFTKIQNPCEDIHSYLPMSLKPNLDFIVILKYDVSVNEIKQLLDLRRKQINREIVQERTNTITYQIDSEVFIDKFYSSDPNKLKYPFSNIKNEENQQNIDKNNNPIQKQCGYRAI